MSSRTKKPPTLVQNLKIEGTSSDGRAIARSDGKVIFVDHAVPGDVVDVLLFKSKKSFAEGRVERLIKSSDLRVDAFCRHFGTCGGCKWQNMDYAAQLQFKQQQVDDAFRRIGHLIFPPMLPILASPKTTHYRNKLEYTFSNKRWMTKEELLTMNEVQDSQALGFHIPQRFDKILDINTCYLQADPSDKIRLSVKEYAVKNNLSFFDLYKQEGLLRNMIIRTSTNGECMVILVFAEKNESAINGLMEFLRITFPELTSLLYIINQKKNDTIFDQEVMQYSGQDYITEVMDGLKFTIGAKTFFQTNPQQALQLYRTALDYAGLTGHENVYDLYTGTGTIACFVAAHCKKVIGVDSVPQSIEHAARNASSNGIHNADFTAGDLKETLQDAFIHQHGKPDVIITDPPRAGMHEDVVKKIVEIAPQRVVYISCNPSTQARDLSLMQEQYAILKVQPVDMFPHTHHVENVVLLEKRMA